MNPGKRPCPGCELEKRLPRERAVHVIARCPLRHDHCIPMKPGFQAWLDERRAEHGPLDFTLGRCPWGVELKAVPGTPCPNCKQRLRGYQFCCAFPIED